MQIFNFYLIAGIILITLEIALTSFYLFIIGAVFILSALLALLLNDWLIIGVFSVALSMAACGLLKFYRSKRRRVDLPMVRHIGQQVEVVEVNNGLLRVKYSGSYWDARLAKKNIDTLRVGDRLTITKFHNNQIEID